MIWCKVEERRSEWVWVDRILFHFLRFDVSDDFTTQNKIFLVVPPRGGILKLQSSMAFFQTCPGIMFHTSCIVLSSLIWVNALTFTAVCMHTGVDEEMA